MKNKINLALVALALCIAVVPRITRGEDGATPQEVVAKVREAASALSKSGDVAQFSQKQSPWVWKDSYITVIDCDKKVLAAHPFRPDLIGHAIASVKDTRGKNLYPHPEAFCKSARTSAGVWTEYWWAKPGEKAGSRKLTYHLGAQETPYVVAAGVYDDKATVAELSKLTMMK
jgi:cytochrome c